MIRIFEEKLKFNQGNRCFGRMTFKFLPKQNVFAQIFANVNSSVGLPTYETENPWTCQAYRLRGSQSKFKRQFKSRNTYTIAYSAESKMPTT